MRLTDCTNSNAWRHLQQQRHQFFFAAVAGVVVVAAYSPVLNAFFIKDDLALLSSAHPALPEIFGRSWLGGFYRPISELLFGIQYELFGLTPWPYHLVSIAFHLIAIGFVFRIVQRLLSDRTQALGTALLFGLHPLHTECVSWISGQMSLLAGVCGLGFLYGMMTAKLTLASSIGLAFVACLGVGTYETFMVIPGIWVILWRITRRDLWWLLGPLAGFALLLGARSIVVGLGTGPYEFNPSLSSGFLNLGYYCYLLLGGTAIGGRILNYSLQEVFTIDSFSAVFPPTLVMSALFFVASFSAIILLLYRKKMPSTNSMVQYFLITATLALLALLPTFFLDNRPRRISYIAVASYSAFLILLIQQLRLYFPDRSKFLALLPATLCIIFGFSTLSRNFEWRHLSFLENKILDKMVSELRTSAYQQIVVDVPDLVGDALFFHSTSAEFWLRTNENTYIPVRHAYERQSRIMSNVKTSFITVDRTGTEINTLPNLPKPPNFDKGRNWIIPP